MTAAQRKVRAKKAAAASAKVRSAKAGKGNSMVSTKGGLRRYAHRSMKEADSEFKHRQRRRYRVTTINWTFATIRGKVHQEIVHRNEYSFTLRNLIKFIRETEHVAEDIIAIEPEPASLADIQAEFERAIREHMGTW